MKKFLLLFVGCTAGIYLFLAVIGVHQFRGHIALLIGVGAILAGLITAIVNLVYRVETMEKYIEDLRCRVDSPEKQNDLPEKDEKPEC